jgi:hypothetical protein
MAQMFAIIIVINRLSQRILGYNLSGHRDGVVHLLV